MAMDVKRIILGMTKLNLVLLYWVSKH